MIIAISTDQNQVSAHFGRCPHFTLITIEEGSVIKNECIPNPGHHPGYLPEYFHKLGVSHIVAGGMGQRASSLFTEYQIQPILGVSGPVETVIKQLKEDSLTSHASLCQPGQGKGYGIDKTECTHEPQLND